MKKAALFFLLCIFLFNTAGYFIAFKVAQYEIKSETRSYIRSNININELIAITINKADLTSVKWEESGREMFYKNELYDIVNSTEVATTITYYCLNDKKEKSLFANLDDHINMQVSDQPLKNDGSKKLVDHVIKLYFHNESLFTAATSNILSSVFPNMVINYTPVLIETNSPPPEFV